MMRGCGVLVRFASIAVVAIATTVAASAQSELPPGLGAEQVQKVCSGCHDFSVMTQLHASKEKWGEIVDNMVSRGAQATDTELDQVVNYLAAHFGPQVNVNKAAAAELAKALALTSEQAAAIVDYRAKHGDFKDLQQLGSVPGIDRKGIESHKNSIVF